MKSAYQHLPSVDRVLAHVRVQELINVFAHAPVVNLIRHQLGEARTTVRSGGVAPSVDEVADVVATQAQVLWCHAPRRVINATGVILHTNLGRAPLSEDAIISMTQAAQGYSNLELNLLDGKRGSRQSHVEALLHQLTGAEAAMVVNNNASAVLLGLAALAAGLEGIVSRGEAVEIGGGFRVPDVLRQSGVALVEVGTTNRTYISDYEDALTEHTAALLKVHSSNFRISGFTHAPTVSELTAMGARYGIPVLHDIGSGCLIDTTAFGLVHEPMPQESVSAGASLTFFSGDKMLGGPQAGIIVGNIELITRLKKHPLARAMRIDKLSLAALTATLLHYLKNEALEKVPVWQMVSVTPEMLKERVMEWQACVSDARVVPGHSTVGGGSLPGETLPTWLLSLSPAAAGGPEELARRLRHQTPPVLARIEDEHVVLDPRTVLTQENGDILRSLAVVSR